MTLGDVAVKARALVHGDTTNYPDANLLIDINVWYQKVVSMILESIDETDFDDARNTTYPIKTTSMVANQRDYPMPVSDKVLKIKRVDITYDGTHYYKAEPIDEGEMAFGVGNDTDVDANFSQVAPRYRIAYNACFIYPQPTATDVANGGKIRMEQVRQITPFVVADYTAVLTDSTVVPGFDDPFHIMLAYGPAWEFAVANELPNIQFLQNQINDNEARLREHYGRKEQDRRLQLKADYRSYK